METFNLKTFSNYVVNSLCYLNVLEKNDTEKRLHSSFLLCLRLPFQALSLCKLLIAVVLPDSLFSEFIQLLIQTLSLLARLNVSFELFHYLGEMAFIGRAQT